MQALIKKGVRQAASVASAIFPLSFLQRKARPKIFLPFYHVVSDEQLPHIRHLYPYPDIRRFKKELDLLLKNFVPVSLQELLKHSSGGTSLPERAFHLSFDDGLKEMHEVVAPILLEKGVPATFFLNNDFIDNKVLFYRFKVSLLLDAFLNADDRVLGNIANLKFKKDFAAYLMDIKYGDRLALAGSARLLDVDFEDYLRKKKPFLSTSQVLDLIKQGFTIGAHSFDHPVFSELEAEEQQRQCIKSVKDIRKRFQLRYGVFAFPFTDVGIRTADFNQLIETPEVELLFGTSAGRAEESQKVLQRFAMEQPKIHGEKLLRTGMFIQWMRKVLGQDKTQRF